jgi:hypothetical protein
VFFHTLSRDIGFRTVSYVTDRSHKIILCELSAAILLYHSRGCTIKDVHTDSKFEYIRINILPSALNVVPAICHVGDVERSIRTIKERLWSMVHNLSYKCLPKLLIIHMLADTIRC